MVGVRIAAVLVVGEYDVRPEFPDGLHQRAGGSLQRLDRETAVRQRRQRIALGQTGVGKPEEALLHAEDLARPGHLLAADGRQVRPDLGAFHRRVQYVAALAAGQRADQHLNALADVPRHGGRALA